MIIRATIVYVISVWDHKVLPKYYPCLLREETLIITRKSSFKKN